MSRNLALTQHLLVPSTQTQLLASVLPISLILAPARRAYRYKYSAPGPYRQLSRSAVTIAFRLSTTGTGLGLGVVVSEGGGGSVGVGAVKVWVAGMTVHVGLASAVTEGETET